MCIHLTSSTTYTIHTIIEVLICFKSVPDPVGLEAVVVLILQCLNSFMYLHSWQFSKGKFWPIATFKKSGLGFLG